MAVIEALEALLLSPEDWNLFCGSNAGTIDLTFADLNGQDLSLRTFAKCDLSGTSLSDANLDGASFLNCKLDGVKFVNSSLVHCTFDKVRGHNIDFSAAVLRDTIFVGCMFTKFIGTGVRLSHVRFQNTILTTMELVDSVLENIDISSGGLHDVIFRDCILRQVNCNNTILKNTQIFKGSWKDMSGSKSVFTDLRMQDLDVSTVSLTHCQISNWHHALGSSRDINLTASTLARADIATLDPGTLILMDSSIIDCLWPPQQGKVTFLGKYVPNRDLIAQPVQDIKGISPVLRREIADAQYLEEILRSGELQSWHRRLAFRFWGATSAYGQSIVRLTAFSAGLVLSLALLLLAARGQFTGQRFQPALLLDAIRDQALAFTGLDDPSPPRKISAFYKSTVILSRISGFLILGIWVSIASNKLSKLGAG